MFLATLAAGALAASAAYAGDLAAAVADVAVAVAFVTCGAIAWPHDRGARLAGPLMVATGVAWLLGDLADELALLHRGPLVQLLVTAPGGRPRTWAEWLVVLVGYVSAVLPGVGSDAAVTVASSSSTRGSPTSRWASGRGPRAAAYSR